MALLSFASPAFADLISLRAEAHGGGFVGDGVFGEMKDESFQEGATGGTYGALVGAEVLFVDGWIQHDQFVRGDGVVGTWTQFMLGLDVELDLGDGIKGAERSASGAAEGGYGAWYGELGMGVGFGVGTGQQVEPPLDNSQVTDKGFVVEARGGMGYRLTSFLSLGVTVPVVAGYFFKSGSGIVSNDADTHYVGVSAGALLNLRVNWVLR